MASGRRDPSVELTRRSLQTIASTDPRGLRLQALEELGRLVHANVVTFFRCDLLAGQLRYAASVATPPEANALLLERVDGRRIGSWAQRSPRVREINSFVGFVDRAALGQLPLPTEHPPHRRVFGPLGIVEFARALCFNGRRFLGYVATQFRAPGRVTPEVTALLNGLMPELLALLLRADQLERAELVSTLHLLTDPSGRIDLASPGGETWLTPPRRERVVEVVAQAETSGVLDTIQGVDGARATLVRMHGAKLAYLMTLEPTSPPELSPDHLLTARQREVVETAVLGATVTEIAQALRLSPDTVRSHLKDIYRRLGIASRVELAAVLAPSRSL